MADLNQCTTRTLASKAGISSQLASQIVRFRKQKGRVQSFSDLLHVDGMTRPIMKTLTSNFFIRNVPPSELVNINNNGNRKSVRSKKKKNKSNARHKPAMNNQNIAKKNSRFLESLPLLADNDTTSHEESMLTIYTPMAVQTTPSRNKIITVYQVASPEKLRPPEIENGNERNNHLETSALKRQIFSKNRRSYKYQSNKKLSPRKESSIRKWLKNTSTESPTGVTPLVSHRRSRSHSRKRNNSRNKFEDRDENNSRSGSCSRSPLLQQSSGSKIELNYNSKAQKGRNKAKQSHQCHPSPKIKTVTQTIGRRRAITSSTQNKSFADGPFTLLDLEAPPDGDNKGQIMKTDRHHVKRSSTSRSMSAEPADLRKERFTEERNTVKAVQEAPTSSSAVKGKVEITEKNRYLGRRRFTRRSLWKDTHSQCSKSSYDHHRHYYEHHHHRSRSHDRDRSRDKKFKQSETAETNENQCIIL